MGVVHKLEVLEFELVDFGHFLGQLELWERMGASRQLGFQWFDMIYRIDLDQDFID